MSFTKQMAKHLRDVHFGGNWTVSNMQDQLKDVTWEEANRKVFGLNTIVALVYHMHYYVDAIINVLEGKPLEAHDKFSFDHPPVQSQQEWEQMQQQVWDDAEKLAALMAALPESRLWDHFTDEKYGHYHRNFMGLIEHTHYHLGQVAVIKKIIRQMETASRH